VISDFTANGGTLGSLTRRGTVGATFIGLVTLGSCAPGVPAPGATPTPTTSNAAGGHRSIPLILAADEGERRVRRVLGGAPLIIKVDRQTAGAPEFVMAYEALPPGVAIPPHRHPGADEIIFVHSGTGTAELGDKSSAVAAGSTIYIPRLTRITVRNTGTEPLVIVAIFSQPGFEELLRDTSVPEGQPVLPLSSAELAAIRARHLGHVIYELP
jgi:mannose-6-phosphate isomerase-like protein (cupin superfamily)